MDSLAVVEIEVSREVSDRVDPERRQGLDEAWDNTFGRDHPLAENETAVLAKFPQRRWPHNLFESSRDLCKMIFRHGLPPRVVWSLPEEVTHCRSYEKGRARWE